MKKKNKITREEFCIIRLFFDLLFMIEDELDEEDRQMLASSMNITGLSDKQLAILLVIENAKKGMQFSKKMMNEVIGDYNKNSFLSFLMRKQIIPVPKNNEGYWYHLNNLERDWDILVLGSHYYRKQLEIEKMKKKEQGGWSLLFFIIRFVQYALLYFLIYSLYPHSP